MLTLLHLLRWPNLLKLCYNCKLECSTTILPRGAFWCTQLLQLNVMTTKDDKCNTVSALE